MTCQNRDCGAEITKIVFIDEESQEYHLEEKGNTLNLCPGKVINSETKDHVCPVCWQRIDLDGFTLNWV